jgi:hypothetical protein
MALSASLAAPAGSEPPLHILRSCRLQLSVSHGGSSGADNTRFAFRELSATPGTTVGALKQQLTARAADPSDNIPLEQQALIAPTIPTR